MDVYIHEGGRIEIRPAIQVKGRLLRESVSNPVRFNMEIPENPLISATVYERDWYLEGTVHGVQVFREER